MPTMPPIFGESTKNDFTRSETSYSPSVTSGQRGSTMWWLMATDERSEKLLLSASAWRMCVSIISPVAVEYGPRQKISRSNSSSSILKMEKRTCAGMTLLMSESSCPTYSRQSRTTSEVMTNFSSRPISKVRMSLSTAMRRSLSTRLPGRRPSG